MRSLINPYYLLILGSYVLVKMLLLSGYAVPAFFQNYWADLCCMPVVLCVLLFLMRLIKRNDQVTLPLGTILFVLIYWAVYFELYLPNKSSEYVGDWVDILMYLIGAVSFVYWQKKYSFKRPVRPLYYQSEES